MIYLAAFGAVVLGVFTSFWGISHNEALVAGVGGLEIVSGFYLGATVYGDGRRL